MEGGAEDQQVAQSIQFAGADPIGLGTISEGRKTENPGDAGKDITCLTTVKPRRGLRGRSLMFRHRRGSE